MIRFNNVSKSFEGKKVIENLNVEFSPKGTICLFGESGIGKSTILNLIARLEKPDSGQVLGIESKKISYVFQDDRLIEWLSVLENIAVVVKSKQKCEKSRLAEEWLKKFDLLEWRDKKPNELSGGMRRKLAIARALAFSGDVILLDEPFKGLDEKTKRKVAEIILSSSKGKLIILVSHESDEIDMMKVIKTYCVSDGSISTYLID